MTGRQMSEELRALIASSSAELDSWLSQEIQDELGTRAFVLRAIAWCHRGALARARADIDAALARRPAHELVELTAAMILFVTRDYDRAVGLLDGVARRHKYMAAATLRVLIARATKLGWSQEQREAQAMLLALGVRDLRAHVHELQRRRTHEGKVDAEAAWALLAEHGPEEVEAALGQLDRSAQRIGMEARLALLRGELELAKALLAGAGDEPAVGEERMALAVAERRFAEALAIQVPSNARVERLRAEAYLGRQELESARLAVERALELEPDHAHASLLHAAIETPTATRMLELWALAPGLLSDAARELDVAPWGDGGLLDDPRAIASVCAHACTMLTADRSTPPSYRTNSALGPERLRHVAPASVGRTTHTDDKLELAAAAQLLVRSIEKQRGAAHRARATRSLDADQIEQFMADGYVHLRGAFPRALADSIVASAHRRLREQPQRALGESRNRRWLDKLGDYDVDDPSTWPEGRVDIEGERKFTIAEFSPFAERAVFQLLGDAARVRTRSWTSNLIAQYPQRTPISQWVPGPEQESWHLDSPSTHTRLDQLHTGLLVFVMYSDLLPDSGNTWLALDSPAEVARALAAAPAGIDFCSDQAGCAITRHCRRFVQVTGEAGDLFLVHPLMLHSASLNPSPRIRFLGNPMIYLQEPLDHRRRDASPVERSIAAALS